MLRIISPKRPSVGKRTPPVRSHGAITLLFALTFSGLATGIVGVKVADAYTARHLYVAVEQIAGCCGRSQVSVLRYPVSGWTIARKPDLTYEGYAGPLAFDVNGNLYAGLGSLQGLPTQTSIFAFRPGSTKPFKRYDIPASSSFQWISAAAVDSTGYLSMGFVSYVGSSYPPATYIATLRLSDKKVVQDEQVAGPDQNIAPQPIRGMAFDQNSHLFVALKKVVKVFESPSSRKLRSDGKIKGSAFENPGGVRVPNSGILYVADLPAPGKVSVSSYTSVARGKVQASRVLSPVGPDDSSLDCCSMSRPLVLAYELEVHSDKIFLPFYAPTKTGGSITGIYEFSRFESGRSRPIQTLAVASTGPSDPPIVAEAVALGP